MKFSVNRPLTLSKSAGDIGRRSNKSGKAPQIFYAIEFDGTMFFYHGKTRIKVTEHFNDNGRPMTDLVEDVVRFTAQN